MTVDALHTYLFAGESHDLAPQMLRWLSASRRFATFVEGAQSKIRKKLRAAQEPESVANLGLELQTAYLLLQERAFSLEYEPKVSGQPRSPDFAVTFTTHSTFMLEVTRLRNVQTEPLKPERLADTVCNKLGQLLPQQSNVLLIGVGAPVPTPDALRAIMTGLQGRAERGDETLFTRFPFRDRADFFNHYRRLSEVLVCELPGREGDPSSVWVNPQAKRPLPGKVRAALYRSLF